MQALKDYGSRFCYNSRCDSIAVDVVLSYWYCHITAHSDNCEYHHTKNFITPNPYHCKRPHELNFSIEFENFQNRNQLQINTTED